MNIEPCIVETRWAKSLDQVMTVASRLLQTELGTDSGISEALSPLMSETACFGSVTNEAIRARLNDSSRQAEKRQRLKEFLDRNTPAWNPADHPDIDAAGGAEAWVSRLRDEAELSYNRRTSATKHE